MTAYLKIENPGVAPIEGFTLLGASTKRKAGGATIGKFGSGNKHGVAVMLRHDLSPIVFAGNLRLEFGVRDQTVNTSTGNHNFQRVVVKYGGKDENGVNRSSTEDLGFVLEYGATDWLDVDLALREFVSNAIDRAIEEGEYGLAMEWAKYRGTEWVKAAQQAGSAEYEEWVGILAEYRNNAVDYKNVVVEVVEEKQVRAKAGCTRVFIPLNAEVLEFYHNLGKWFLHFSEPELLKTTILPKKDRNLGNRKAAVVYRRGVRVREFMATDVPSLFDYNLEHLELDESRKVDDWNVQYAAAAAFGRADEGTLAKLWQSFIDGQKYWEHGFTYGLDHGLSSIENQKKWVDAFESVASDAVLATETGGLIAARKGYKVVSAPEAFVSAAERAGIRTPSKVLTQDDREGRSVLESTAVDAEAAVDFAWHLVIKYNIANGRVRPMVRTFRKIMDGGSQTLGFYRDGTVYLNTDIVGDGSSTLLGWRGLSQQLLVTAMEEVSHHVTGATDESRDFQDFLLNLIVYMAKEMAGID